MPIVIEQNIEVIVHQQAQVDWLISHKNAYIAKRLKVWVKLNSGMNRLGFKVAKIIKARHQYPKKPKALHAYWLCILPMPMLIIHSMMNESVQFLEIKEECSPILALLHVTQLPIYNGLKFLILTMSVPGSCYTAHTPFADKNVHDLDLKSVMTFTAEIIALNNIQAGEGRSWLKESFCRESRHDFGHCFDWLW